MKINENLRIDWRHNTKTKETICQIIDNEDNIVVSGIAKAWHKDPFCRKTGRKHSLTRALAQRVNESKDAPKVLSKDVRTAVWNVLKANGVKIV